MPHLDNTYLISQIFWLVLSVVILYCTFVYILLPSIVMNLHARNKQIEDLIQQNLQCLEEINTANMKTDEIIHNTYRKIAEARLIHEQQLIDLTKFKMEEFVSYARTARADAEAKIALTMIDLQDDIVRVATQAAIAVISTSINKINISDAEIREKLEATI